MAPLVACAVLALFRDSVANTNAALGLVLLIVAAAATGIRAAGIVAALSSAAWFDFFLTEPYNSFKITDRADFETAVLLVLVGVAVSEVALWGYRQQARVSQEQGYLAGVCSAATVAAGRTSTGSLIDQVAGRSSRCCRSTAAVLTAPTGPRSRHSATAPWSAMAAQSTSNATGCRPTPRSDSWSKAAVSFTAASCSPRPPASLGHRWNSCRSRSHSPTRWAPRSPPSGGDGHRRCRRIHGAQARDTARAAVVVGALGVVFGDIGTSPIYTVQTAFNPGDPHPVTVSMDSVFGIISLIFWSVMIVVTITYVLVLRADNDGEGGIMALITLIRRRGAPGETARRVGAGCAGCLRGVVVLRDSMITPAISVLSAVEGLKVVEPSLESAIVPITAVIIVVLFAFQRVGTAAVGRLFGPVMIVWFVVIAVCGIRGIAGHPEILKALSPTYALDFLVGDFSTAFFALAAVVLAVTGAEALYADLGHFGRPAIARAWLILVFPACILSYMGQGSLILGDPGNVSSPFFLLVPDWGRLPMVLLATAATVIASQAVITGAYSVASQAAQLGYLPRLRITHTSEETVGQIYVPWINWLLMVSVLTLVFAFQSSTALAYAFGMAVTGTITITTLLFFYVVRHRGASRCGWCSSAAARCCWSICCFSPPT